MGLWDEVKTIFNKAKEDAREGFEEGVDAAYTQDYNEEDAKRFANDMKNNVDGRTLRLKTAGRAPLDYLEEGEKPQYLLSGFDLDIDDNDEGSISQLFITDRRVVLTARSVTSKSSRYTISFSDIIGLSVQKRLTAHIRIQTAGHSYKISAGGSDPELANKVVDYIREQQDKVGSNNQESEEENALNKLDKLADLRDRGIVSEEEFEQKKERLMDEV